MAKRVQLYRAYKFTGDKDPVIDKIHTMMEDTGVTSYSRCHELSGVSASTVHNWIEGDTKRPQYATIAAVAGALGYEATFVKVHNGRGHIEIKKKT
jgi:transcriptional regulator with XRE-family HTH domain